jgi:hypothetical protein
VLEEIYMEDYVGEGDDLHGIIPDINSILGHPSSNPLEV